MCREERIKVAALTNVEFVERLRGRGKNGTEQSI